MKRKYVIVVENCSIEKNSECHFERAIGESRNLFLDRFLRCATLCVASVEMTVGLFNRVVENQRKTGIIDLTMGGYE